MSPTSTSSGFNSFNSQFTFFTSKELFIQQTMSTKYKSLYKTIIILSIIGLILFSISFAQKDQVAEAPEALAELKEIGKKILKAFPKALKAVWQAGLDIWRGMWKWFKNFWDSYIFPFFENIWQKILDFFQSNILERFRKIMQGLDKFGINMV